jgi:hypothetical protein
MSDQDCANIEIKMIQITQVFISSYKPLHALNRSQMTISLPISQMIIKQIIGPFISIM